MINSLIWYNGFLNLRRDNLLSHVEWLSVTNIS
jgi:hypothetical protein